MPSRSRWFVGSSRMRSSPGEASAAASATRLAWPPERSEIDRSRCVVIPSRSSAAAASQPGPIASRTVPAARSGVCPRYLVRIPRPRRTSPLSGVTRPAITRSKVDLPVPLMPTMPSRSPSQTVSERSSKSALSGSRMLTRWRSMSTPTDATVPCGPWGSSRGGAGAALRAQAIRDSRASAAVKAVMTSALDQGLGAMVMK